tara:strand:- start:1377 stop:2294 length:918 start_codon:yes stop_codon:yes gene_type:complete
MYKSKYLKYKSKYLNLKNQSGGSISLSSTAKSLRISDEDNKFIELLKEKRIEYKIMDDEKIIYRSVPKGKISLYSDLGSQVRKCIDTGKIGIYLSEDILLSLAIMLENNEVMEIGAFTLCKNIVIPKGKYAYRNINPERYFKDGEIKPNVEVDPEDNISHIDCGLLPLKNSQRSRIALGLIKKINEIEEKFKGRLDLTPEEKKKCPDCKRCYDLWTEYESYLYLIPSEEIGKRNFCEIFISSKDIESNSNVIKLDKTYMINTEKVKKLEDLLTFMQVNNYPNDISSYIENKILIEIPHASRPRII